MLENAIMHVQRASSPAAPQGANKQHCYILLSDANLGSTSTQEVCNQLLDQSHDSRVLPGNLWTRLAIALEEEALKIMYTN